MGRRTILLIAAILVAALGTGLVWLYADRADDAAMADQAPVEVLVAKVDIAAGTKGSEIASNGAVELRTLPAASVPSGALSDLSPVTSQVTLGPLFKGQVLLQQSFGSTQEAAGGLSLPSGSMAISVQLGDPERVAGFVKPGSEVALFTTGTDIGGNSKQQTAVLLSRVTVAAVGPTVQSPAEAGSSNTEAIPTAILTLAVNQEDAQKVILASQTTTLTMALLDDKSKVSATAPGTTSSNLLS